jgi:Valyl tRNA synthetase tRNA binding arm
VRQRLENPGFTSRAKADVVDGARRQEATLATRADQIRARVQSLCGK